MHISSLSSGLSHKAANHDQESHNLINHFPAHQTVTAVVPLISFHKLAMTILDWVLQQQGLYIDDTDELIADTDYDDQVNDDNNADDTELSTEPTKLQETVIEALSSDGWNFSHLEEAGTVFPGGLSLTTPSAYTPIITHSGVGPAPLW